MEQYGAYKVTISPYNEPLVELLYSSNNSEQCILHAHDCANELYLKHSSYSPNMGIIPLKTKWVVYNTLGNELEIFYACRRDFNEGN